MSWEEVTELVLRAQTGDRAAYGELVRRFQGSVYAMALTRVRDPLEAQELAREVFVHGMRSCRNARPALLRGLAASDHRAWPSTA